MADIICVAAVQSGHPAHTSTVRRSLNLSQGASALARRFSRSSGHRSQRRSTAGTAAGSITMRRSTIASHSGSMPTPMHIRIVPSIDNPSRSLIFDIVDRDLEHGVLVKVGRFTDRSRSPNHMSFKSKVVSRAHCEFWLGLDGKLYLRDTKSSSGTFLNHIRLSPPNQESRSTEVKDGDIVQLGVDYQGGQEEIYRCVKMRFEINRTRSDRPLSYNVNAFNHWRSLAAAAATPAAMPSHAVPTKEAKLDLEAAPDLASQSKTSATADVEECCICLYAMAPFQALFVAPCAHSYHYKCIRPLLQSHPGFQCPICRTYSDLEASVAVETEEVAETSDAKRFATPLESQRHSQITADPVIEEDSSVQDPNDMNDDLGQDVPMNAANDDEEEEPEEDSEDNEDQEQPEQPYLGPSHEHQYAPLHADDAFIQEAASSSVYPHVPTLVPERCHRDALAATLVSSAFHFHPEQDTSLYHSPEIAHARYRLTSPDERVRHTIVSPPVNIRPTSPQTLPRQRRRSERRESATVGLMEKLKTVLFEKRKSAVITRERERKGRPPVTPLPSEEGVCLSSALSGDSVASSACRRCPCQTLSSPSPPLTRQGSILYIAEGVPCHHHCTTTTSIQPMSLD